MIFRLRDLPSLIGRGLCAIGASIRRYYFNYRTERYFARCRKDITRLHWYMIKCHYSRQDRRRIARQLMKYTMSLSGFDFKEGKVQP